MKGYLLGFVIFIAGIPTLMWWASGMPEFINIPVLRMCIAVLLALAGLALSVWSIIYMKRVGEGNPFDAMGHEVDPRTKHLMTDGPYRRSRNPMLSGTYLYYIGILVALWSWWALLVFACVFLLMSFQVRSEEKRLEADFGEEYLKYKKSTGRFFLFIMTAFMVCGTVNLNAQPTYTDIGFNDIADVFAQVKSNETVVFLLRHGERGRDYSKAGLLTENGKAQARMVGEKIKSGEAAFYAHSDYDRTKQTCENIAIGRGDEFVHEEWYILNGDWYRKDIDQIKAHGWDNWESLSQWAYEGGHEEGFYNLEERSKEWLDSLKAHLPGMKRINVLVSHDYMVTPMAVYTSHKQVDLHYWVNRKWINYLAGVAIIIDKDGNMRFKTVRGLDSGVLNRNY